MFGFNKLTYFVFIFFTLSILACKQDLSITPVNSEEYALEYLFYGGWVGPHTLTISENGSTIYQSYNTDFSTELNATEISGLYNTLVENHFFSMDSVYPPERYVADGFYYQIIYKSNSNFKKVATYGEAKWPSELRTIINYLEELTEGVKSRINSGVVTINSKTVLKEWPFSDTIKLADNLDKKVTANEEIFNHFRENYEQRNNITYFEGDWIYNLEAYGYSKLESFRINIYNIIEPVYWPFTIKLEDIPEEGIILKGQDYSWIKEKLTSFYWQVYSMDDSLVDGAYLYKIDLVYGNIP